MSFFDIIENLQKKPRGARVRVAATLIVLIMTGIITIWVANLRSSFLASDKTEEDHSVKPLTLLRDVFRDSFEGAKKEFEKLPKLTGNQ